VPLSPEQQDLAEEYAGLARGQAWSFFRKSTGLMDIDTCLSAAMLGLVEGLNSYPAYLARHPGFDPSRADYRKAYLLKRIRGAILDEARHADHMTRSGRNKAKAIRQAEDDGIRDEAGLAAATGIDPAEVRRVQADALVPVSLDDQDVLSGTEYAGRAVTDLGADVESQAAVNVILAGFLEAFDALPAESRVILAMRFHLDLDFTDIAERLRTSPERVAQLHDAGVLAVHAALLRSVSAA
jgi:RNA polymerase sigma factor FliA